MTKRQEYLYCEEKLGELGLYSLKSRSLGGGLFSAHKYPKGQCKEEEPWYFQECLYKRQWAKTGSWEVPSEHWEAIHYCASDRLTREVVGSLCWRPSKTSCTLCRLPCPGSVYVSRGWSRWTLPSSAML